MSAGSLGNAEVIGGGVVTISGDLSGLRGAEAEARAITNRINSMFAKVQIGNSAGAGGMGGMAMPGYAGHPLGGMARNYGGGWNFGGSFRGNAIPAMGGMNAAAGGGQQIVSSNNQLVNAINQLTQSIRSGSDGGSGGGSGGGGGGRSGSGGGLGLKNLFSARGLSAGLGLSMTGIFAAIEALKVGGEFAVASNIEAHPERLLRSMNEGAQHSAYADSYLRGQAQASASNEGSQTRLQAVESIPLAGTLVKFVDDLNGVSIELKEQAKVIQDNIAAHQRSTAELDKRVIQAATESGDPREAARARASQEIERLTIEARAHPDDPAAQEALRAAQRHYTDIDRPIASAQFGSQAAGVGNYNAQRFNESRAVITSAEADASAKGREDTMSTLAKQHQASLYQFAGQEAARSQKYNEDTSTPLYQTSPAERHRVTEEYRSDRDKAKSERFAEEIRYKASQEAEQYRVAKQAVPMADTQAQAARLRSQRRYFEADQLVIAQQQRQKLDITPNSAEANALGRQYQAQNAEARIKEGFRRQDILTGAEESLTSDKYLMKNMGLSSQAVYNTSDAMRKIRDAEPFARGAIRAAELSKLKRQQYEMNPIQGGDFGIQATAAQVVGDPYDLSGRAADMAEANKRYGKAKHQIEGGGKEGDSNAGAAGQMGSILSSLIPSGWAMVISSYLKTIADNSNNGATAG